MFLVKYEDKIEKCDDLTAALVFAKSLNVFVVITDGNIEIVGKFGVDSIKAGLCPNGVEYTWTKRRKLWKNVRARSNEPPC